MLIMEDFINLGGEITEIMENRLFLKLVYELVRPKEYVLGFF